MDIRVTPWNAPQVANESEVHSKLVMNGEFYPWEGVNKKSTKILSRWWTQGFWFHMQHLYTFHVTNELYPFVPVLLPRICLAHGSISENCPSCYLLTLSFKCNHLQHPQKLFCTLSCKFEPWKGLKFCTVTVLVLINTGSCPWRHDHHTEFHDQWVSACNSIDVSNWIGWWSSQIVGTLKQSNVYTGGRHGLRSGGQLENTEKWGASWLVSFTKCY